VKGKKERRICTMAGMAVVHEGGGHEGGEGEGGGRRGKG